MTAASGYPLSLDLTNRRVLVAGAGPVAARRARALVEAGAVVHVVAPYACEDIRELAADGRLQWQQREYDDDDLSGAWLVHAATDDRGTNAAIAAAAEARRIWCVRADDGVSTTARTPAVARAADVTVAVTAGGDPRRAAALRDAVRLLLDTGALPTRRQRRPAAGAPGTVALVGGGPGDPGLITVRGRQLLAEADVVVVDRLAPRAWLDTLDPEVEVVDAGKAPHAHAMTQEAINALIVERARAGRRVVRLKGGDPFVLGRGGEEAQACVASGIPVEIVPGVTSAVAVPAAAGIPATHRGLATAVTIASGHGAIDAAGLARTPGTLMLLMAMSRLDRITAELIAHGKDAHTPAAVVSEGTTGRQRTVVATLGTIARAATAAGLQPPAVVVVGDVVALREELG